MLGSNLMMAPILQEGQINRDVYFPKGNWTHYFTNQNYDFSAKGDWVKKMSAELGQPLVFVKSD